MTNILLRLTYTVTDNHCVISNLTDVLLQSRMNAAGGKSRTPDNNKILEDDLFYKEFTSDDSDTLFQAYQVSLLFSSSGKM